MSEDLKPAELWAIITAMPRPSLVVDFPRKKPDGTPIGQLRMQVLTQEEQILCSAEAERFTKKAVKEVPKGDEAKTGYENVYNNSAAVEVLFKACRQKDDPSLPFFPSGEALRKALTADEVGVLLMHYYTTQASLGPIVAHMSKEEMDAWVERLAEGGNRFPLDWLSSEALKDLVFTMALQIRSLRTDNSLPGSPPEETSPQATPEQPAI